MNVRMSVRMSLVAIVAAALVLAIDSKLMATPVKVSIQLLATGVTSVTKGTFGAHNYFHQRCLSHQYEVVLSYEEVPRFYFSRGYLKSYCLLRCIACSYNRISQSHSDPRIRSIDIDECSEATDNCAHNCTDTDGSYTCSCRPGYRLASDNQGCNGKEIDHSGHSQLIYVTIIIA